MARLFSALLFVVVACAAETPIRGFDFAHIEGALSYFSTPDDQTLREISETHAANHLKRHSDRTGYYEPDATTLEITADLISAEEPPGAAMLSDVTQLLAYAKENPDLQKACIDEAIRFLPQTDDAPINIYVTWGYDIGVASDLGASLNFAHEHFQQSNQEIWFYCTHEAHHVGVIRSHAFPTISEIETVGALVELVHYLTFLEGTAVFAAYDMRERFDAMDMDEDYRALQDQTRMENISNRYEELLNDLSVRDPDEPLSDADWAIVGEMSGGERLWYRHGAKMAMNIFAAQGMTGLHEAIAAGPEVFFKTYRTVEQNKG